MNAKHILTAVLVGTLALACEDPNAKQKEADKAREQAQQESDKAAQKAEQTRLEQQAKADEKQREANMAMDKARAEYRTKLTDVMSDLDKHIADLRAKTPTASAKDKTSLADKITTLEGKRALLNADLKDVDSATSAGWDELKGRVDGHIRDARSLMVPLIGKT